MIDDFVLAAISFDGSLNPSCDWGFLLNKSNSLYNYFERQILERFPEIKGTFFVPLKSQNYLDDQAGYKIFRKNADEELKNFFKYTSTNFDVAFHGIKHTYFDRSTPKLIHYEFNDYNISDIQYIANEIKKFEELVEIKLIGGKFPGYRYNEFSLDIIERLGFLWWTKSKSYLSFNKESLKHNYFGKTNLLLNLPLTYVGNAFKTYLSENHSKYSTIRMFKTKINHLKAEKFLRFLYENQLIITLQEHFQNQRTDGIRQKVNIFDDLYSIEKILNILRGADIWYSTTNQLAHYLESYDYTEIEHYSNNEFRIT
jgi:hypothetical protein